MDWQKIRDEMNSNYWPNQKIFNDGFDACLKIMLEREKIAVEALDKIRHQSFDIYLSRYVLETAKCALQQLKNYPQTSEGKE